MALAALAIVATTAHSHSLTHGDLVLDHPYAVPSLAGVANGAAYLRGSLNLRQQVRPVRATRAASASSGVRRSGAGR